ncbi:MAG: ribosome small subunit-dependent GTPase A [Candidatus Brocadiaceae bacterium]|nr:ribosome small subunit-dependent GTPase A [Candidatus Brocadiaceae bacterium]
MEGTVIRIRSALCEVDAGDAVYECKVRGRLVDNDTGESKPLAVGDRVILTAVGGGEGVVEQVLPRRTKLSRTSPRGQHTEHVIVANVDQLLIVTSVRVPPLTPGIIDRYIIAGETGRLEPILCINKTDQADDPAEYEDVAGMYESLGYRVLRTSALQRRGLDGLRAALRDRSTVFAGHSGVGKSSLLNALQPGLKLRTGPVTTKGRHVTTYASLLKLSFGGYVVDTPGIREFTLWDIRKVEVAQFFPHIWELSADCRMPDCVHMHEPHCAVKAAVESGELDAERYHSYVRIVEGIEEIEVPRATDVEQPQEQVAKKQRRQSRSTRKQAVRHRWREELAWDDDETP